MVDLDKPFIPLSDSERETPEGRPWADLSRFPHRVEAAAIYDKYTKTVYKTAESLFFKGGKLSDYGYYIKPELDQNQVYELLQAMLMSPYPNHIQRDAAITLALLNWCDTTPNNRVEEEPILVAGFFKPGTRNLDASVLVGKNRN